jgi:hypothetical protein
MSRTDLAWLAVAAYALHIMEERILNWLGSARKSLDITLDAELYRTVEAVFLITGAAAAMLSATQPIFALSFAAFLLANAIFFHIWPMIRTGGHFSPGIITSVFFFLPIGWAQYALSPLQPRDYVLSIVIGVVLIFSPLLLMKLREHPSFGGGSAAEAPKPKRTRK